MLDQNMLGQRIQTRRKALGLTQEQLGSVLGVSNQAVSKWELGESAPDIALLPDICQALHMSADMLLGIVNDSSLEMLGEQLAVKLSQVKETMQDDALMRVLWQLHLMDNTPSHKDKGNKAAKRGLKVSCRSSGANANNLESIRFMASGCALLVSSDGMQLMRKAQLRPQALETLRTLLLPGNWKIAESLLACPQCEEALAQAYDGDINTTRHALQSMVKAGIIVQGSDGFALASRQIAIVVTIVKLLASMLGEPSARPQQGSKKMRLRTRNMA